MGFFSSQNSDLSRVAGKQERLASDWGNQASGYNERSGALWDQQGDLYNKIGAKLFGGEFNTPGVDRSKERAMLGEQGDWWKKLGGSYGKGPLTADEGGNILSYAGRATGKLTDAENAANQAIRDRMSSQQSALYNQALPGAAGWGNPGLGGAAADLARRKALADSLRTGTISANADIRDYLGNSIQQGYGGMERAQGQVQNLAEKQAAARNTPGHSAGLGEYLAYLRADPRGSSLDWAEQTNKGLGGEGSAFRDAAQTYGGGQGGGWGSKVGSAAGTVGKIAGAAGTVVALL